MKVVPLVAREGVPPVVERGLHAERRDGLLRLRGWFVCVIHIYIYIYIYTYTHMYIYIYIYICVVIDSVIMYVYGLWFYCLIYCVIIVCLCIRAVCLLYLILFCRGASVGVRTSPIQECQSTRPGSARWCMAMRTQSYLWVALLV